MYYLSSCIRKKVTKTELVPPTVPLPIGFDTIYACRIDVELPPPGRLFACGIAGNHMITGLGGQPAVKSYGFYRLFVLWFPRVHITRLCLVFHSLHGSSAVGASALGAASVV